jgi:hypothetical protein
MVKNLYGRHEEAEKRKAVLEGNMLYFGRRRRDLKFSTGKEKKYLFNQEGAQKLSKDLCTIQYNTSLGIEYIIPIPTVSVTSLR